MKQFVPLYVGLFLGYFLLKPVLFTDAFYDVFCMGLAQASAAVVWLFDETMFMEGPILRVVGGSGVWVTRDCSALNFTWFLCAAVLAYPAPWMKRLLMTILAMLLVQAVNVLRLVTLYFVQKWSPQNFDLIHLDVWPIIFVVTIVVGFLSWVSYVESRQADVSVTP